MKAAQALEEVMDQQKKYLRGTEIATEIMIVLEGERYEARRRAQIEMRKIKWEARVREKELMLEELKTSSSLKTLELGVAQEEKQKEELGEKQGEEQKKTQEEGQRLALSSSVQEMESVLEGARITEWYGAQELEIAYEKSRRKLQEFGETLKISCAKSLELARANETALRKELKLYEARKKARAKGGGKAVSEENQVRTQEELELEVAQEVELELEKAYAEAKIIEFKKSQELGVARREELEKEWKLREMWIGLAGEEEQANYTPDRREAQGEKQKEAQGEKQKEGQGEKQGKSTDEGN
ncbi:hypothetical protein AGMMS49556_09410 [Endomicrobiia bacterium]|nr:hypothetical protein AGMMS49556_09410 [Endomicrobiia bacterium]